MDGREGSKNPEEHQRHMTTGYVPGKTVFARARRNLPMGCRSRLGRDTELLKNTPYYVLEKLNKVSHFYFPPLKAGVGNTQPLTLSVFSKFTYIIHFIKG